MLFNYYLSLLAILGFTSFTLIYADPAEVVLAPDDNTIPSLPFDEKALLAVADHPDTKSPVSQPKRNTGSNRLDRRLVPQPNGECPRPLYSLGHEDGICARTFTGPPEDDVLWAAQQSNCVSPVTRRISCQLCHGYNVGRNTDIQTTDERCGISQICKQVENKWNAWGHFQPQCLCVTAKNINQVYIARKSAIKEYCSKKYFIPSAKGTNAWFHAYFYDRVTGLQQSARWLYLKVDEAYAKSVQNVADWGVSYPINSHQRIEMCVYPFRDDATDLELDWTVTV